MPSPMAANEILDREFFELRAKILELAASLDRMDRSAGDTTGDPRVRLLQDGLDLLCGDSSASDRAERVQLLFSRSYETDWQQQFNLLPSKPR